MIESATVRLVSAVLYVGWAAVLLAAVRRRSPPARRYCYPFVAVVALAAVAVGLRGAGIGVVPIGAGEIEIPQLIGDYATYPLLFGFAAFVAGASRRYVGLVVATVLVMRVGYDLADLFDGALGLAGTGGILVGYVVLLWLYFGPVAAAAARQSPKRALFYRKTRNLVLFVFGILIVWAMFQLFGAFDPFTGNVTLEYIDFLLRVGFAAFVIANAETLVGDDDADGRGDGPDGGTATAGTTGGDPSMAGD
ncbi:bacteriorhodopsin [Halorubrum alkaliphilum]|uniref:Bacteriorhodopsin n=1 Tax=Halorubrum alkaliphilum TaxID=261290 RepID=A0A8T4GHI1_9EURY|nr:bacteriorhodopsin [Halorubrum alkaliphilum]MBP1923968.1 bacteriorhodopsin [Halorubrum alkaliphilum]